jgi:hypothetical protein
MGITLGCIFVGASRRPKGGHPRGPKGGAPPGPKGGVLQDPGIFPTPTSGSPEYSPFLIPGARSIPNSHAREPGIFPSPSPGSQNILNSYPGAWNIPNSHSQEPRIFRTPNPGSQEYSQLPPLGSQNIPNSFPREPGIFPAAGRRFARSPLGGWRAVQRVGGWSGSPVGGRLRGQAGGWALGGWKWAEGGRAGRHAVMR